MVIKFEGKEDSVTLNFLINFRTALILDYRNLKVIYAKYEINYLYYYVHVFTYRINLMLVSYHFLQYIGFIYIHVHVRLGYKLYSLYFHQKN